MLVDRQGSIICHHYRVGPILKQMGRVEALEWLIKETQPIG